jgi:threonine dehydrogenase-like Zn-dependent dehydrogenase
MKAWRIYNTGDMRLDEVPVPSVKPGWALIKIKRLQPSITEVEKYNSLRDSAKQGNPAIQGPVQLFGHEFCGEVVEIGAGVDNLKTGDRVFYYRSAPCGYCYLCRSGHGELCTKGPLLGLELAGCLAEYMVLPAVSLIAAPASLTDAEVTALQPLVGVVATVAYSGLRLVDTVVVLGQGTMGLNVTQVARVCGAARVIAVDIREEALEFARLIGADLTVNASVKDPVAAVLEATSEIGADIVFECAGGNPLAGLSGITTLNQALKMVRDQGRIQQIALLEPGAAVDVQPINKKGLQYRGFFSPNLAEHARYAIDLVVSQRVKLAPLITHTLHGLEKVPEAFEITGHKARYKAVSPAQVVLNN